MKEAAFQAIGSQLMVELPAGWSFEESLTLSTLSNGANVIFSSQPLDAEVSTEDWAKEQEAGLKAFSGYKEISFEPATLFGGDQAQMRRYEWTPDNADPVIQIQVYYVREGRGYTATATAKSSAFSQYEDELTRIIEGLTIRGVDPLSAGEDVEDGSIRQASSNGS